MLLTALRTDTTHDLSQKRPERIPNGRFWGLSTLAVELAEIFAILMEFIGDS